MKAAVPVLLGALLSSCVTDRPAPALSEAYPSKAPEPATINPDSIGAQMAATWRHYPKAVSEDQFERDQAKCRMMGQMAPVGAGSEWLKIAVVFINCMKAEGYPLRTIFHSEPDLQIIC